jgi:phosphoglycolate phosphatase-like HAD superfamily hydrolase
MIRAVLLDFDGVILESVVCKTRAFEILFSGERPEVREAIKHYHLQHGGLSRYEKFRHIYACLLRRPLSPERFVELCCDFSELVTEQVVAADWVPGAWDFIRRNYRSWDLYVVSGTPETELRMIIARKGLATYFRGVYGSPDPKPVLIRRVLCDGSYRANEAVLVGDAETDRAAARETGALFIGRTGATFSADAIGINLPDLRSLAAVLGRLEKENGDLVVWNKGVGR